LQVTLKTGKEILAQQ